MGILPNTLWEGARTNLLINTQLSDDFASKTESEDEGITRFIIAPGAEIPKWCNHLKVLEITYHSGLVANFQKSLSVLLLD